MTIERLPKKKAGRPKRTAPKRQPTKHVSMSDLDHITADNLINAIIRLWLNGVTSKVISQRYNLSTKYVTRLIREEKKKVENAGVYILTQDITDKIMRLFYNHNQLSADITLEYMSIKDDLTTIESLPANERTDRLAELLVSKVNLSAVMAKLRSELRDNDRLFFSIVKDMGGVSAIPSNDKGSHTDSPTSVDSGKDIGNLLSFDVGDKVKFRNELEESIKRTQGYLDKLKDKE